MTFRCDSSGCQRNYRAVALAAAIAVLVVALVQPAAAQCPNACSLHGDCGVGSACTCHTGFTGPDCSKRACPFTPAWVDKVTADNDAHNELLECSNAGICNYDTGECECFVGFTGKGCSRTKCPNDCSGRGQCLSIAQISAEDGTDTTAAVAGDGVGPSYANWDSSVSFGCKCDYGYTGPDCSLLMCPKGDDPATTNQFDRVIQVTTDNTAGSLMSGTLRFQFNGDQTGTFLADANQPDSTAAACQSAWEEIEAIESARCFKGSVTGATGAVTWTIALVFADFGQNNLHQFDTNPPLDSFTCDSSAASPVATITCVVTDHDNSLTAGGTGSVADEYKIVISDDTTALGNKFTWSKNGGATTEVTITGALQTFDTTVTVTFASTEGHTIGAEWTLTVDGAGNVQLTASPTIKEHLYCSGRGTCDFDTGICSCLENYEGVACGSIVTASTETDNPLLQLLMADRDYSGNMLLLETERAASTSFNFIQTLTSSSNLFTVDGTGAMSSVSTSTTGTVSADTLTVANGVTVTAGGLDVVAGGLTVQAGAVNVLTGGTTITNDADTDPAVTITASEDTTFTNSVLRIVADKAGASDFKLIEGLSGTSTSVFSVDGTGLITTAQGIDVTAGGMSVDGGLTATDGASVEAGGLFVSATASSAAALTVDATHASYGDNLILGTTSRAAHVDFNMLLLRAGGSDLFQVSGTGTTTVHAGGIDVAAGGATIQDTGLLIDTGGQTITAGGLVVTADGATVTAGGLAVDAGGATVVQTTDNVAALSVSASHGSFDSDVLYVAATAAGSATTYDLIHVQQGANDYMVLRGDGRLTLHENVVLGDANDDTITVNAYVQGATPLVFEGSNTGDGYQLSLGLPGLTASRTYTFPDADGTISVAAGGGLTDDRIPYTSSGAVVTSSSLSYDGSALDLDGSASATFRSSAGTVAVTAATTLTATATGDDLTVQSTNNGVTLLATDSTNGKLVFTSGNTATLTAGSTLSLATSDANPSGAVVVGTGDASSGTVGSVTISTGEATGGTAGAISLSVGKTNTADGGDITITAGKTEADTATGGDVVIEGGQASHTSTTTGGSVTITAGGGGTTGGDVVLRAGDATNDGAVIIQKNSPAADVITVESDGGVEIAAATTLDLTTGTGALTLQSTGAGATFGGSGAVNLQSTGGAVTVDGSSGVTLSTAASSSGTAGAISVVPGLTNTNAVGAAVTLSAGETSGANQVGGAFTITAGEGSGTGATGGSVTLAGGAGTAGGGDVIFKVGGGGGTEGEFAVRNADDDADRIRVSSSGAIAITSPSTADLSASGSVSISSSASTATLQSSGNLDVTSTAGTMTLSAKSGITIQTQDASGNAPGDVTIAPGSNNAADGSDVILTGGASTGNNQAGGDVSLTGGAASVNSNTGGSVVLTAGDGTNQDGVVALRSAQDTGVLRVLQVTAAGGLDVDAIASVDIATRDVAAGSAAVNLGSGTSSAGSSGALTLSTGAADGGAAGAISITVGTTDTGDGSDATITGGKTTADTATGGDVVITAGQATSTTTTVGGSISLVGGAGGSTGGSVVLIPGEGADSSKDGDFVVRNAADDADRIKIATDGSVTLTAAADITAASTGAVTLESTGSTTTVQAASALTLSSSAGAGVLKASTSITVATNDETAVAAGDVTISAGQTSGADGAAVSIAGGKVLNTVASKTGGAVSITGGDAEGDTSTGGNVVLTGGEGSSTGGNVILQAGDGNVKGGVQIKQGGGANTIVEVNKDGALLLTPQAASTLSTAAGSLTLDSAAADVGLTAGNDISLTATAGEISLSAGTSVSIVTAGAATAGGITMSAGSSSSADGADVAVTGGAATGTSKTAGSVSIQGGVGSVGGNTGGSVVLQAGNGASTDGEVRIMAADDTAGSYTMRVTAAGAFDVDAAAVTIKSEDIAGGSGTVVIGSGTASGGASGAVTLASGATDTGASGTVTVSAGLAELTGGAVSIIGGESDGAGQTAGAVSIAGGAASSTGSTVGGSVLISGADGTTNGGSITLSAGAGSVAANNGQILLEDGQGTDSLLVGATGAVTLSATADSSFTATGILTLSSADTLAVTGEDAVTITSSTSTMALTSESTMTIKTNDVASSAGAVVINAGSTASGAGAAVTVAGGSTSGGATAGAVSVIGGSGTGGAGTGGDVIIQAGTGTTANGEVVLRSASQTAGQHTMKVSAAGALDVEATAVAIATPDVAGGTGSLSVASGAATTGASGALTIATGDATGGLAGQISISVGQTNQASPNALTITGSESVGTDLTAGSVTITGGAATGTDSTGGDVNLLGGGGAVTGGDVVLQAGTGSGAASHGNIVLQDAGGTARLTVTADGGVTVAAATTASVDSGTGDLTMTSSSGTATMTGAGITTVQSTANKVTLEGETGVDIVTALRSGAASGPITITPGETDDTTGAAVTITGGKTTDGSATGGTVSLVGGESAQTGGSVAVTGGIGTANGGDVILKPGTGSPKGNVELQDTSGTARVTVSGDGLVTLDAATTLSVSTGADSLTMTGGASGTNVMASGDILIQSSAGTVTLQGNQGLTIQTESASGVNGGDVVVQAGDSTAAGADVTVTGGTTSAAGVLAGAVSIAGGQASAGTSSGGDAILSGGQGNTGTGGDVILRAGEGAAGNGVLKIQNAAASATLLEIGTSGLVTLSSAATFAETLTAESNVVFSGVQTKAGAATITFDDGNTVLRVSDADNGAANDVTVSGGVEGRVVLVINDDIDALTGDLTGVAANSRAWCVYVGGAWEC